MEDSSGVEPTQHQKKDATAENDQATKKVEHGSPGICTAPQITPSPATPSETSCSKKDETPRWKKVLEFLAIVLAIIVALIYGGQLWVMKQQLTEMKRSGQSATDQMWSAIRNMNWMARSMDGTLKEAQAALGQARTNFISDQRPYLLITQPRNQTLELKANARINWNIQFINYGRSPAVHVDTVADIWFGSIVRERVNKFFEKQPRVQVHPPVGIIIAPNAGAAGPDSPGLSFTTIVSKQVITEDDIRLMTTGKAGVVIAARSWYQDLSGNRYYTDFCRMTLATGAIASCPQHNEIH